MEQQPKEEKTVFIKEAMGSYLGFRYSILMSVTGLRWFYIDIPIDDRMPELRDDVYTRECSCKNITSVRDVDENKVYLRLFFQILSPKYCLPDLASLLVIFDSNRHQLVEALSLADKLTKQVKEVTDMPLKILEFDKAEEICKRAIESIFSSLYQTKCCYSPVIVNYVENDKNYLTFTG